MKIISILILLLSVFAFADTPPIIYQFTAPLVKTSNRIISIPKADATHNGYLSSGDYTTFSSNVAAWGSITGTLSNQTDLQSALNAKEPSISSGTTSQYWRGDKSFQTLNTSAVTEGTNLYYTAARFNTAFSGKTTTDLTEGTNLYYTSARFNSALAAKSTSDISEGSNLYYTQGRFDSAFTAKSTTNLSEGSNLYYTDARARSSVSATAPLSYVSGTGVFSVDLSAYATLASPAFTGTPTAPTASVGTSTTQIATTAFVLSQGFQGATGSMPTASSASLVTTTSASTTFVTAITTSINVTAASAPVLAKCVLDMTSATSASVANMRVTINAVAGGTISQSLTTATTQHLTAANQYLSAALTPGTYTVNCDFARASGTGTVTVGQGSLTAVGLQGTESNGISQLTGLGLSAGPGSGLQSLTGTLTMAGGGTNASLTAANGAIPYSTASAFALLAAGTSGQILRSGGAGAPTWTSETFPASTTINQILYSSAANVVSGLATANTGALVTSSTGVPSLTSGATANRLLRTNGTTVSFAQAALATDVSGTLPFANGGTGTTAFANQRIPFSNGSIFTTDANFIYDTTNTILNVGGSGTAKINAINASGSHTALQAYNSSAGNAFQATNVSGYTAALISRQNNATSGASIGFEFGRGTAASPTGALNGDQIGSIVSTPDASSGSAFGYGGAILFVASEDATTTATGGEIVLATTPNTTVTPVERFRISNSGNVTLVNTHLKSTQTTPPTAAADAGAGTGATCTVSNATDSRGRIEIITGTLGLSTGSYCTITFNKTHGTAPICVLTPTSSTLSTSVYVSATTTTMSINFAVAGGISSTYDINYQCLE